jgi:hypothetical protein
MIVGKARANPSEALFGCSIVVIGFWHYPQTLDFRLERLAGNIHSSLLRTFVIYGRKKFYNTGHQGIIGLLLDQPGLDLSVRDKSGLSPFAAAMTFRNNAAARKILQVCFGS